MKVEIVEGGVLGLDRDEEVEKEDDKEDDEEDEEDEDVIEE